MKNVFIIIFALAFSVGSLVAAPIITPPPIPIPVIQLVKWANVKAPAACSEMKYKHKIDDSRSICFETEALNSMPVTFLNCNGSIKFFNTATGDCGIQGGVDIGPAESTYIRSKGSLGHSGYDIFVFGFNNSRYIEFDVITNFTSFTDAAIVAHRNAKINAFKNIKACLKKVVSTPGAKCVISTLGVVTE